MATKLIKAWIDGAVQEIEVEDIISPEQPLSVEDRVDKLEDKHEVVITDGNLLVGNGTTDLEEMTPEEVLSHINGASVTTMTTDEYEALGEDEFNANTLYVLTDSDENGSLRGKRLSVLGDSISTYTGYIPDGYTTYYTASNLASVDDTWWKKVIDATGMELCANNSYSGTRVAVTSWYGDYAGCQVIRNMALHDGDNIPDIIIVAMGCNDFNNEIAIGDYEATDGLNFDNSKFSDAYAQMLYYITSKYPMAKVYCCTCTASEKNIPTDGPELNGNSMAFYEFNDIIRKIAKMYHCGVIDMESCGITHENLSYYMVDGIQHPNAYGHSLMANKVIETIDPANSIRYSNIAAVMKPSATSVSLNATELSIEKGKTATLTATVAPSDAVVKTVKWKSSDTSIATVENGVVTAVGTGDVIITVTTDDGGHTAQCSISVTAPAVVNAQVTSITNTPGQYIDTGYVPTANTSFELDWMLNTHVAKMDIAGAKGLAVKAGNAGTSFTVQLNRHSNAQSLTYLYDASERSVLKLDGTTLYRNGETVDTKTTSAVTMENSLVVFGTNGYGSTTTLTACTGVYTLYGFKIYESDELVKNFVPWVDTDGKACLKEIIGNTYHYDAAGGTFEYIA